MEKVTKVMTEECFISSS